MSLNAKQNVKCPKCGQTTEITVWNSITVHDSEDLKKDLLHGKINMFYCPVCSYTALMPTPMLYHDEQRKLMILFSPCYEDVPKRQLFDNIQRTSAESGELDKLEGYNLRFVTDRNELLEKILIFDNGMNDKTTEVLKLMILSRDLDKAEQRMCRFGKRKDDGLEFMIYDAVENQTFTSDVPKATYDTIDEQLRVSGVKPYSFGWEMVDAAYAAKLLNGFNS